MNTAWSFCVCVWGGACRCMHVWYGDLLMFSALQNRKQHVNIWYSVLGCYHFFLIHTLWPSCFFCFQNQLSAKFRALRQEHLVVTKAKPNPGLWSHRWICSFWRPCARRINVTLMRCEPTPPFLYRHCCQHISLAFTLCVLCMICSLNVFTGEECVPVQFLSFPGLPGSVESSRFSSGRGVIITTFVLLFILLSTYVSIISFCHYWASVWLLLIVPVCFHIHGVRKMCTQAVGHFYCVRGRTWQR